MAFFGKDSDKSAASPTEELKQRVKQETAQELAVADVTELINVSLSLRFVMHKTNPLEHDQGLLRSVLCQSGPRFDCGGHKMHRAMLKEVHGFLEYYLANLCFPFASIDVYRLSPVTPLILDNMITIIGSLNYDLVTTAQRIPDGGETVTATTFATYHGGKGANEARAARRLSPPETKVKMVGLVGGDSFGNELLEGLKNEGVDVSDVKTSDSRTGVATILVDSEGENRILVYPGANGDFKPDIVSRQLWAGSRFVLLQNEIPLKSTLKILELASQETKTVYNPSPILDVPADAYRHVDYLVVNAIEAGIIANGHGSSVKTQNDAENVLDELLKLGVRTAVVVTLGAHGAVFASKEGTERGFVPAAKVEKVVDTTGAGDTFLAGFISQVHQGKSLEESLKFATRASAIVVSRKGAAASMPTLEEVESF